MYRVRKKETDDERRGKEREREKDREKRKTLREREAFSRPPSRAVVRFGPRGRGEYERPNYENDPRMTRQPPSPEEIASSNKHTALCGGAPRLPVCRRYGGRRGW